MYMYYVLSLSITTTQNSATSIFISYFTPLTESWFYIKVFGPLCFKANTKQLYNIDVNVDEQVCLYISSQAETSAGPNAGFRFPGSGVAVYEDTTQDTVCTYGGLMYAYDVNTVRFWRPTEILNGGVVCVPAVYGKGSNSESNSDVTVVVQIWLLYISK